MANEPKVNSAVEEIVTKIKSLPIEDVALLVDSLCKALNVSPDAVVTSSSANTTTSEDESDQQDKKFNVLAKAQNKLKAIQAIREAFSRPLGEAMELAKTAMEGEVVLQEGLTKKDADALAAKLKETSDNTLVVTIKPA